MAMVESCSRAWPKTAVAAVVTAATAIGSVACVEFFDTELHDADGVVDGGASTDIDASAVDGATVPDEADAGATDGPAATDGGPSVLAVTAPLPHVFAGANHHRIYVQHDLSPDNGTAIDTAAQIRAMREAGLHVLRIFLHQEDGVPWERPPVAYTFEDPIGTYHEASFEFVDRMMPLLIGDPADPFDDVRLIIALFNHLQGTSSGDVDERLYFGTYGEVGFYTNPNARQAFKNRISHVLNHRNPYLDNRAWKDLDLIVGWEPMNEPGIHTVGETQMTTTATLADWLSDMALHIKSIDTDGTFVVSGTGGGSQYEGYDIGDHVPSLIAAGGSNGVPGVDVYTIHFYGSDLGQRIADARSVLPPGTRLWVTEFGDRRDNSGNPLTYDRTASGVLGRLQNERIPWMFWRLGIRREDNAFARFVWDETEWEAITESAASLVEVVADFETGMSGRWSRNDGSPVDTSLQSQETGTSIGWEMTAGFEELVFNPERNIDVSGRAVTFRAKSSSTIAVEVQLRDDFGGFTGSNPIITITSDWQYFQFPVDDVFLLQQFQPERLRNIVFWAKEGSNPGVVLSLDDIRIW